MTVLILGFPHDIHIHAVRWALDQVGVDHHVLYTPDMPGLLHASVRVSAGTPAMARSAVDLFMARQAVTTRSGIDAAARRCGRPACPRRIGLWQLANAITTSAHSAVVWPPTPTG